MVPEVGYLLKRSFLGARLRHRGGPGAVWTHAFGTLGLDWVCSIIRDNNAPSQAVARRNGMEPVGHLVKHYYGMDMPHTVWGAGRGEGTL